MLGVRKVILYLYGPLEIQRLKLRALSLLSTLEVGMSNPDGGLLIFIRKSGKAQLSTELTISADEFDVYDVYATPTTISFHLREFNVCHHCQCLLPTISDFFYLIGHNYFCRIHGCLPRSALHGSCGPSLHRRRKRRVRMSFYHIHLPTWWLSRTCTLKLCSTQHTQTSFSER